MLGTNVPSTHDAPIPFWVSLALFDESGSLSSMCRGAGAEDWVFPQKRLDTVMVRISPRSSAFLSPWKDLPKK